MARQCLNAEVAAARAATHPSHSGGAMDWLLHIDIDELFLVQAVDPMEQQACACRLTAAAAAAAAAFALLVDESQTNDSVFVE